MSNRGRALTLIVLAATLAGCAELASQERQQDLQVARQSCASSGFADGTPQFAQCVEAQLALIADERRRALEETVTPPTRVQPDSGELCLPTAAGLSFTC
jgi:hypothetical protein